MGRNSWVNFFFFFLAPKQCNSHIKKNTAIRRYKEGGWGRSLGHVCTLPGSCAGWSQMTQWWGASAKLLSLLIPKTGVWWARNESSFSLGLTVLGRCPLASLSAKFTAAVPFPCHHWCCPFNSSSPLHPNVLWNDFGCVHLLVKPLAAE